MNTAARFNITNYLNVIQGSRAAATQKIQAFFKPGKLIIFFLRRTKLGPVSRFLPVSLVLMMSDGVKLLQTLRLTEIKMASEPPSRAGRVLRGLRGSDQGPFDAPAGLSFQPSRFFAFLKQRIT